MDFFSVLAPTMPVLEIIARGTITYLLLYALIRIVGRRESAGLGLGDVLVIVLVADAASTGMTGDSQSLGDGFILVGVILFWNVALDALNYWFPAVRRLSDGKPRPLIEDGEFVRKTMRREFITEDEIRAQLRLSGVEDVSQVRRALLESNGGISIITDADNEDAERAAEKRGQKSPAEDALDDTSSTSGK